MKKFLKILSILIYFSCNEMKSRNMFFSLNNYPSLSTKMLILSSTLLSSVSSLDKTQLYNNATENKCFKNGIFCNNSTSECCSNNCINNRCCNKGDICDKDIDCCDQKMCQDSTCIYNMTKLYHLPESTTCSPNDFSCCIQNFGCYNSNCCSGHCNFDTYLCCSITNCQTSDDCCKNYDCIDDECTYNPPPSHKTKSTPTCCYVILFVMFGFIILGCICTFIFADRNNKEECKQILQCAKLMFKLCCKAFKIEAEPLIQKI